MRDISDCRNGWTDNGDRRDDRTGIYLRPEIDEDGFQLVRRRHHFQKRPSPMVRLNQKALR